MQYREKQFGTSLLSLWQPDQAAAGVILLIHGLTEHIGRYEKFARFMTARGLAVAGFDLPGHGKAILEVDGMPRPGYFGPEGSWKSAVKLLDSALEEIKQLLPGCPVYLLGFSLGSFLARAWLVEKEQGKEPLPIRGLLLVGTGDQGAGVLGVVRALIRRECRRHGEYNTTPLVQSLAVENYNRYFRAEHSSSAWLLADPDARREYEQDPLCCRTISAGLFRELLSCMIFVAKQETPHQRPVPVSFLSGAQDPVGEQGKGVRRAAARFWGAEVIFVPGRHDILHDVQAEEAFKTIYKVLESLKDG